MKYPDNKRIIKSFPHPAEPFDNWFDRHPVIAGGIFGAILGVIMYIGLII